MYIDLYTHIHVYIEREEVLLMPTWRKEFWFRKEFTQFTDESTALSAIDEIRIDVENGG